MQTYKNENIPRNCTYVVLVLFQSWELCLSIHLGISNFSINRNTAEAFYKRKSKTHEGEWDVCKLLWKRS